MTGEENHIGQHGNLEVSQGVPIAFHSTKSQWVHYDYTSLQGTLPVPIIVFLGRSDRLSASKRGRTPAKKVRRRAREGKNRQYETIREKVNPKKEMTSSEFCTDAV